MPRTQSSEVPIMAIGSGCAAIAAALRLQPSSESDRSNGWPATFKEVLDGRQRQRTYVLFKITPPTRPKASPVA
jgi:hypothetical protein